MGIQIIFETHSLTEDNEHGIATGWHPGRLSEKGRLLAKELGSRRRDDKIQAVFTSDLRRAIETVEIAFGETAIPILHDWRLRECNYGKQNSTSTNQIRQSRAQHLDEPYPSGESCRQAVVRVGRFLDDLHPHWEGMRVLVIGHVATWWGFEHYLNGVAVEDLVKGEFVWRPGWEYLLT